MIVFRAEESKLEEALKNDANPISKLFLETYNPIGAIPATGMMMGNLFIVDQDHEPVGMLRHGDVLYDMLAYYMVDRTSGDLLLLDLPPIKCAKCQLELEHFFHKDGVHYYHVDCFAEQYEFEARMAAMDPWETEQ